MRTRFAAVTIILTSVLWMASAQAQTSRGSSGPRPFPLASGAQPKTVNISVSYQFFLDGNTADMDEQAGLADKGRKHLYRMLARECEVLLETIAEECYINRANVSSRVQNYRRRRDGIQISGSATYRIELKPSRRVEKPNKER
jgi:hypothetical protein